ncbi:short-chain dehydrogenase/reductase [Streptomyces camponoticapitis]|uniref:Short-chain dehydrogenase/reductase n=1 Tax=Streptomyces camponoticapitis TaxID=1616125 RepID=A0ABQ2E2M4_9ACTN|nr:oxidoreductase [Streptomyces camponoticapitis]GGJ90564.1 short-chain dehydrogenase/reductase [Streptomyces camponoticapitis]
MARHTWLITGSSRGIGYALAKGALEAGDNVVATARRPEKLAELADTYGDRVRTVALDVTDPEAARTAVAVAVEAFGSLDVVANNAGQANSGAIEDMDPADFRAQIETNLFGVVNVTRAALPHMRARRTGHFLQFSSIGGRVGGTAGMGAYQTAKFAVEGFSQVLNTEVGPLGIKVTIVEPGAFRTDWAGSSMTLLEPSPDYEQTVGRMHAYRRENEGKEQGDPARAARVLIDIVNSPEPPLRILLGADAVTYAEKASKERAAEAARWADVSGSTAFPTAEAAV